jgi:two-component system response regulator RegX3
VAGRGTDGEGFRRPIAATRRTWNLEAMPKVLVVDDEESLLEAIRYALSREGIEVVTARDGGDAMRDFEAERPDLVVLDLMLPTLNGWDVCRRIRASSQVPILMLTARDAEVDRVVGLEMGADDYVTKPFSLRELVARVRALLRRAGVAAQGEQRADAVVLEGGGVRLDQERHEVTVRGDPVNLPLKEFELLEILMENRNRVLTRQTLIDRVWGYDYVGDTKTLDVHVKRLRARVEEDRHDPKLIVTVRGVGYRFDG